MKKKRNWKLIIIIGVIAILALYSVSMYNGMVTKEEKANEAWAQVENVYQRRMDLIPNLVKTVQGAANFEKETLDAVISARARATQTTIDPTNLTEANMEAFQQAQDNLSSSLGRLMVVVEKYPELKANENFRDLQAQLEGTENRITVERKKFNEVIQEYNKGIRRFPAKIFAGLFGFEQKAYFKATEGAEKAPEVEFGF